MFHIRPEFKKYVSAEVPGHSETKLCSAFAGTVRAVRLPDA